MDRRLRGRNAAVVSVAVVVVLMLALMSSSVEKRPGVADMQAAETDASSGMARPADGPALAQAAARRDILFVKVPKSGGTTLAITLSRYARRFNAKVADPGKTERTWVVDTCEGSPASKLQEVCSPPLSMDNDVGGHTELTRWRRTMAVLKKWKTMAALNEPRLQVFSSHACAADFMFDPKWWSLNRRPLAITMLREPWEALKSQFRYLRKCCAKHELSPATAKATWCIRKCHLKTMEAYMETCAVLPFKCSQQYHYIAGDRRGGAAAVVDRFNVVLLLDRLDEGLALLRALHGFPFETLPYLSTNKNTAVEKVDIPPALKQRAVSQLLKLDYEVYNAARAKLDRVIGKLDAAQKSLFEQTLRDLERANLAASKLCADRRTEECLASPRTGAFHSGACYSDCIEAVASGETDPASLPKVLACAQCPRFKVNCEECECNGSGGATCHESLVCTHSATPQCLSAEPQTPAVS